MVDVGGVDAIVGTQNGARFQEYAMTYEGPGAWLSPEFSAIGVVDAKLRSHDGGFIECPLNAVIQRGPGFKNFVLLTGDDGAPVNIVSVRGASLCARYQELAARDAAPSLALYRGPASLPWSRATQRCLRLRWSLLRPAALPSRMPMQAPQRSPRVRICARSWAWCMPR